MIRNYKISDFVRIKDYRIFNQKTEFFKAEDILESSSFLKAAYEHLQISYPKFHKMDELSKMGILATEVLFYEKLISPRTALVFSNSSSSLEADLKHRELMEGTVSPAIFVYTLPNIVLGEISIRHKLQSENAFFICEKFNAGLLLDYSESLLESGNTPAVVCGWIECKNAEYDVFLCLISTEGETHFSAENLEALYKFENE